MGMRTRPHLARSHVQVQASQREHRRHVAQLCRRGQMKEPLRWRGKEAGSEHLLAATHAPCVLKGERVVNGRVPHLVAARHRL